MREHFDRLPIAHEPGRQTRWAGVIGLAAILVATLLIYRGAFQGFFVQDDFGWLYETRFESLREYLHSFFRFNNARVYRPLSQETFFLAGQKLFGLNPFPFHCASVAFHLIGAVLAYRLARKFFGVLPSLAATLFFAVHAAHFRSVYWISAIPEPMALVFYLASLLLFIRFDREENRRFYYASLLAMGLGMLCKESILSLPLVLGAYCFVLARRRLLWTLPYFGLSGSYAILRLLSPSAVGSAPYQLTFGREALENLWAYLSWAAGFTEPLVKLKLQWRLPDSYPIIAAAFVAVVLILLWLSRNRRVSLFAILWFVLALQPVLYFRQHIDSYYLAPALAAVVLLLASFLPEARARFVWYRWAAVPAILFFALWSSWASVKRQGAWWNERSFLARHILEEASEELRQVPPDRIAYLFGFGDWEFGAMQNDAAFLAFGISPYRYIPVGLNPDTAGQIEVLRQNTGISDYYCFLYSGGRFVNWTEEFRRNPRPFVLIKPLDALERMAGSCGESPVRLEVSAGEITAGKDSLTIRVHGLEARAIDLLYTRDGELMPAHIGWTLNAEQSSTVFVSSSTPKGEYRYRAIRNSQEPGLEGWYPVNVLVKVR